MKTVILNGSPRPTGDTMALVDAFCREIRGQVRIIHTHQTNVSPCIDCRGCFRKPGCVIKDEMQGIYQAVEDADVVVLASPLHFSTLTGSLLALCSRFQALYAGRRQGFLPPREKSAQGVLLLAGGGSTKDPACAARTARIILREVGAPLAHSVMSLHTDATPAREDGEAIRQAAAAARTINALLGE